MSGSLAHNVLRLCDVAEKTHLILKFKTNEPREKQ